MAKKSNRLSINALDKVIESCDIAPKIIKVGEGDNAIDVEIKNWIPIKDQCQLVIDVVNGCFDGGSYLSYMYHSAFITNVAEYYTNLPTTNIEKLMKFVDSTGFENTLKNTISPVQWNSICAAIKEAIAYRNNRSKWEDVATGISQFLSTATESIKDTDISELVNVASKLSGKSDLDLAKAVIGANKEKVVAMPTTK